MSGTHRIHGWGSLAVLACAAALSAGCSAAEREDSSSQAPAPVEKRRQVIGSERAPSPQRAPDTSPPEGAAEAPEPVIAMLKADLAQRALVKPGAITVVSATEQIWPDGALGCPEPGQVYPQVVLHGYRVILKAAGETYDYHTDLRGRFVLCDRRLPLPPVRARDSDSPPAK